MTIAFLVTGRFVISAFGMLLPVFLTDFAKIALATDRVRLSRRPETWRSTGHTQVAVVLGVAMVVEACGLLAIGWRAFGLMADEAAPHTFTFQTLFYFALFSILSIRERRRFWASRPSGILMLACSWTPSWGPFSRPPASRGSCRRRGSRPSSSSPTP